MWVGRVVLALTVLGMAAAAGGHYVLPEAVAVAPSIEAGRDTSVHWCASCHNVLPESSQPVRDYTAASFVEVAERLGPMPLRDYLSKPHIGPMPGFTLNPREVEDVAAYIETMRSDASLPTSGVRSAP